MSTDVAMGAAFDLAVQDLERLVDRHFSAQRTLVVERESEKHWTASIGDTVLYRSPDVKATLRFAWTFAERNAGVTVYVAHKSEHGGQGRGLRQKEVHGRSVCGRCGQPYDGRSGHGPGHCQVGYSVRVPALRVVS